MKKLFKNFKLQTQLIFVSLLSISISFVFLLIILPSILTPFYENNIYKMLEQPLTIIENTKQDNNGKIAYIIYSNNKYYYSSNIVSLLGTKDIIPVIEKLQNNYGKFKLNNKNYYYKIKTTNNYKAIALTNDDYIKEQKTSLNQILIPTMSLIIVITILILWCYSTLLVKKISIINKKIKNIDNPDYNHNITFYINDELKFLLNSIEQSRNSLNEKQQQKNNMFQNISHELKTPISVISSHIEALEDQVITQEQAINVIKEETNNLNKKVSLIMKLNKLNFFKNDKVYKNIDIIPIINKSFNKFKFVRKDINFILQIDKNVLFYGDIENWETIIDNLLENFMRFAINEIKITISKNKIVFYNDGKHIKEELLEDIFESYKIDSNGKHGLGLAIVKQTLNLFNYTIKAKNETVGVSFEIIKNK